jgi:hypothetical protein
MRPTPSSPPPGADRNRAHVSDPRSHAPSRLPPHPPPSPLKKHTRTAGSRRQGPNPDTPTALDIVRRPHTAIALISIAFFVTWIKRGARGRGKWQIFLTPSLFWPLTHPPPTGATDFFGGPLQSIFWAFLWEVNAIKNVFG